MSIKNTPPSSRPQVGGTKWRDELRQVDDELSGIVGEVKRLARHERNRDALQWLTTLELRISTVQRALDALHHYRDSEYTSDARRLADAVEILLQRIDGDNLSDELEQILSRKDGTE